MAIQIDSLSDLDSTQVQQQDELLAEMLQEAAPVIDVRSGAIRELLVQPAAMFAAKLQEEQARLRRSSSLVTIAADPTLADDEVVDNIASNYNVERSAGGFATGAVTVVLEAGQDVSIAAGAVFTGQGKQFAAISVFTGRVSAGNVVAETDRLMTLQQDGTYAFQITVEALEAGPASQLAKGTTLIPEIPPVNFAGAMAAEDFIGGLAPDDNAALVAKLADGAAAKALSGRSNMRALLRENLPEVVADSIVGMGDPEMLRDRHNIFGIAYGGRVDWYVRTQLLYRTYGEVREATLVEVRADGTGVWQISLLRDDWPGLYDVAVKPADDVNYVGYFEVIEDIRGYDVSPLSLTDSFVPDVATVVEAAYSVLQTVTVRFHDTLTSTVSLALGAKKDYELIVRAMPGLLELQQAMGSRNVRNAAGDILLRAPLPCFLQLSFIIELPPGAETPDSSAIADALAAVVNNYGFTGRLPSSLLHDVIHNNLPNKSAIVATDMLGRIRRADGSIKQLRSASFLQVPTETTLLVSGRTVSFFLDAADVSITYVTADLPEI